VASGEGGCFVHEEKLGVLSWLEERASSVFEFEFADNPAIRFLEPLDVALLIVNTASVAEPYSPLGDGMEEFERINTILEWHPIPSWFSPGSLPQVRSGGGIPAVTSRI
jgi:hypothetical protein